MAEVAPNELLIQKISQTLKLSIKQVTGAIELLDEGNTIPFITRYRKEATGGLDEVQLRDLQLLLTELREVTAERERILKAIESQGKLTDALKSAINSAETLKRLDELYAPYRSKRKTRADEAREKGLEPLATAIWTGRVSDATLDQVANACLGKHPALTSIDVVKQGVQDLVAAKIAEQVDLRDTARMVASRTATVSTKLNPKSEDAATFQDYADFEQPLSRLPPHRVLALNRGEEREALKVSLKWDQEQAADRIGRALNLANHPSRQFLDGAVKESLKRLIGPAIERESRREITQKAHQHALTNFGKNLRQLLLQAPLLGKIVLAVDPGYRTGCKLAVLGREGQVLTSGVIYITDAGTLAQAEKKMLAILKEHHVDVIAIGNGTASRETQELVSKTIIENSLNCRYVVVNEAGASIYSASDVGREEFPDLDATVRGTISIGRRLQDPLSELVKIEPQHIGVGMYQHDLPEKDLTTSLSEVVESSVNHVGVELNNSSAELLKYVSGLNKNTAKAIVKYREANGNFRSRDELKKVPGVGPKAFEQAAGFLRIRGGVEPLDSTWVHPESYPLARKLIQKAGIDLKTLNTQNHRLEEAFAGISGNVTELATELKSNPYTIEQILQSLKKPGRDPREELAPPMLRTGVLSIDDLQVGTELVGVVTNVVDFGAFVDVGLKNDGLVHISKLGTQYISSPHDVVSVGQSVTTWVDSVDQARGRIGLTMVKRA